jgi:Arc/MetJ family transcription regulator
MRTNIDIDEELIAEAMIVAGLSTKKATVEEALKRLIRQYHRREAIREMAGLGWEATSI